MQSSINATIFCSCRNKMHPNRRNKMHPQSFTTYFAPHRQGLTWLASLVITRASIVEFSLHSNSVWHFWLSFVSHTSSCTGEKPTLNVAQYQASQKSHLRVVLGLTWGAVLHMTLILVLLHTNLSKTNVKEELVCLATKEVKDSHLVRRVGLSREVVLVSRGKGSLAEWRDLSRHPKR